MAFTYWGGSVAFSMMQTRLRLDPRSMWYSSSAKIKASGVSTLSSTRCDRMPSWVVTCERWQNEFELRPKRLHTRPKVSINFNSSSKIGLQMRHFVLLWYASAVDRNFCLQITRNLLKFLILEFIFALSWSDVKFFALIVKLLGIRMRHCLWLSRTWSWESNLGGRHSSGQNHRPHPEVDQAPAGIGRLVWTCGCHG